MQATPPLPFVASRARGGHGAGREATSSPTPPQCHCPRVRCAVQTGRGSEQLQAHRASGKSCLLGLVSAYIAASPISAQGHLRSHDGYPPLPFFGSVAGSLPRRVGAQIPSHSIGSGTARECVLSPRGKARRRTKTYPKNHLPNTPTPLNVMLDFNFLNIPRVPRAITSLLAGSVVLSPHGKARRRTKTYPKPIFHTPLPP